MYIYIYVCVCVCFRFFAHTHTRRITKSWASHQAGLPAFSSFIQGILDSLVFLASRMTCCALGSSVVFLCNMTELPSR